MDGFLVCTAGKPVYRNLIQKFLIEIQYLVHESGVPNVYERLLKHWRKGFSMDTFHPIKGRFLEKENAGDGVMF